MIEQTKLLQQGAWCTYNTLEIKWQIFTFRAYISFQHRIHALSFGRLLILTGILLLLGGVRLEVAQQQYHQR